MKTGAIFFDLDGTLVDSHMAIVNCINYALQKLGLKVLTEQEIIPQIGTPLRAIFSSLTKVQADDIEKAVMLYRERFGKEGLNEQPPFPGVIKTLQNLNKDFYLLIATNKPTQQASILIEHLGLSELFLDILGIENFQTQCKANEVEKAIKKHNLLKLDKVFMVGDRSIDIQAGKHNKLNTIGVTYGYGTIAELKQAGAGHLVDSFEDLCRLVA